MWSTIKFKEECKLSYITTGRLSRNLKNRYVEPFLSAYFICVICSFYAEPDYDPFWDQKAADKFAI